MENKRIQFLSSYDEGVKKIFLPKKAEAESVIEMLNSYCEEEEDDDKDVLTKVEVFDVSSMKKEKG